MSRVESLEHSDQYTVGWIAALPIERSAAVAMLDAKHGPPEDFHQKHGDSNSYTWGSIGKHNVVIALLPTGVYGTTSAATTAASLASSFPRIRIGLLVGIGGAIATPEATNGHDIRLGDVAISLPNGISGGVIQYDLGKATSTGQKHQAVGWQRKGVLNRPPDVLLKALAALQSDHMMRDTDVPEILSKALQRYPKMLSSQPGFKHQGFENDRLFPAAYDHVGGPDCSACIADAEVPRTKRSTDYPEFHYGTILSGNTLVKSAAARDSIVKDVGGDENCICFEMEAAGLMDNFPCLVIRGICDYADSHKNDRWQQYAAATAAAYAKELLQYVHSQDLQGVSTLEDVLGNS